MKRYDVELSPDALEQVGIIQVWWSANRPSAPELFLDELCAVIERLEDAPLCGGRYEATRVRGVRRLYMPKARYHVYYTVDDEQARVLIHAVWHAAQGHGPLG